MDERERDLYDLYAGLAMMGLITKNGYVAYDQVHMSFEAARMMVEARREAITNVKPQG
jgi:hypothetical protein